MFEEIYRFVAREPENVGFGQRVYASVCKALSGIANAVSSTVDSETLEAAVIVVLGCATAIYLRYMVCQYRARVVRSLMPDHLAALTVQLADGSRSAFTPDLEAIAAVSLKKHMEVQQKLVDLMHLMEAKQMGVRPPPGGVEVASGSPYEEGEASLRGRGVRLPTGMSPPGEVGAASGCPREEGDAGRGSRARLNEPAMKSLDEMADLNKRLQNKLKELKNARK